MEVVCSFVPRRKASLLLVNKKQVIAYKLLHLERLRWTCTDSQGDPGQSIGIILLLSRVAKIVV